MRLVFAIAALAACGAAAWLVFASSAPRVAAGDGGSAASVGVPAANLAATAAGKDDDTDGEDTEESVPLDSVPAGVLAAAKSAKPGISLTGAEKETEGGAVVYCLTGTVGGKTFEVEVTAAGEVVEVEEEDGEDDGR